MLKLRGTREDIDHIESLLAEDNQAIDFNDNECRSDSGKDYRDISCEDSLPVEMIYAIKAQFPDVKLYAQRVDPMSNIPVQYYSLPGTSIIKEKWSAWANKPIDYGVWWEKDKNWYITEKPDGTVCISGYYKWEKEVYIPETIDGKRVTELGAKLFYNNPVVEEIHINDNIKKVPASAFSDCRNLVVYSNNDNVNKILQSRVLLVTKEDDDKTIEVKKAFNYTVSDAGVTITAFKSEETDVTIPAIIEGKNVIAIAKDAFLFDKFEGFQLLNCVIIPITVRDFDEKCFHAVDVKYLVAPGIELTRVDAKRWKNRLAKGFIAKEADGIYTDEEIKKKYIDYLKRSFVDYIDDCLNDEVLFNGLLKSVPLSPKQSEMLFNRANELNKNEEKLQILNYQESHLKNKSKKKTAKEFAVDIPAKPLSKSAIKKLYSYEIKNDGTVNIKSYKGEEINIIIPDTIEEKSVTSIGDWAFDGFVHRDTPQIMAIKERRRKIETIRIPASIIDIGKHVFDGCGCETDGNTKYDWRAEYNTAINVLNEKYPARVKLLISENSPVKEYAENSNLKYETY